MLATRSVCRLCEVDQVLLARGGNFFCVCGINIPMERAWGYRSDGLCHSLTFCLRTWYGWHVLCVVTWYNICGGAQGGDVFFRTKQSTPAQKQCLDAPDQERKGLKARHAWQTALNAYAWHKARNTLKHPFPRPSRMAVGVAVLLLSIPWLSSLCSRDLAVCSITHHTTARSWGLI